MNQRTSTAAPKIFTKNITKNTNAAPPKTSIFLGIRSKALKRAQRTPTPRGQSARRHFHSRLVSDPSYDRSTASPGFERQNRVRATACKFVPLYQFCAPKFDFDNPN